METASGRNKWVNDETTPHEVESKECNGCEIRARACHQASWNCKRGEHLRSNHGQNEVFQVVEIRRATVKRWERSIITLATCSNTQLLRRRHTSACCKSKIDGSLLVPGSCTVSNIFPQYYLSMQASSSSPITMIHTLPLQKWEA